MIMKHIYILLMESLRLFKINTNNMADFTLEDRAAEAAFEHTVFMALADLYTKLNPEVDIATYLDQLQRNKREEKARILNRFRTDQN